MTPKCLAHLICPSGIMKISEVNLIYLSFLRYQDYLVKSVRETNINQAEK
jgi:hypothetical protein